MELKGSKTEANLMSAFAGESMARNKYTYFAAKARQSGFEQIGYFFEETANNEKEHAEIWYKTMHGGIGEVAEILKHAAEGENFEHSKMYPEFAKVAKEEGFERIAYLFDAVAKIEKLHEERYLKLLSNVNDNQVFSRNEKQIWICTNCGYIHEATSAPEKCPVCEKPKAYFEIRVINY